MIIDIHAHPLTKEVLELPGAKTLFKPYEAIFHSELKPISLEQMIEGMDKAGVDKTVLCSMNMETMALDGLEGFNVPNELIAEAVNQYPERFIGFACVDPRKGYLAGKELEKAVRELGLAGLGEILPSDVELYPNDKLMYPLYEKALELDIPVLIHTGQLFDPGNKLKYNNPIFVDDVAVDFPSLRLIVAHFGWPWTEEAIAVVQRNPNVYFDISGWAPKYLPKLVIDYMNGPLSDKVLFGTDFPLIWWDRFISELRALPLKESTKQKVLGENAKRLLKLA